MSFSVELASRGKQALPFSSNKPNCIIAHTVKGKGVSFMEANHNWHAKVPTQQELDDAVAELSSRLLAGVAVESCA